MVGVFVVMVVLGRGVGLVLRCCCFLRLVLRRLSVCMGSGSGGLVVFRGWVLMRRRG